MRTKIARQPDNEDELAEVRDAVERLVKGEAYATGSRMLAYRNVGASMGKSASWVRKLLGRQSVAFSYLEFRNLVRAYPALCERVEAAAAASRARAERLKGEANAVAEGGQRPGASAAR